MVAALLAAIPGAAATASATPLLSEYPGGLSFASPTEPHVLSTWFNPGALGHLGAAKGRILVYAGGAYTSETGDYTRPFIDPATGEPGAGSPSKDSYRFHLPDPALGFALNIRDRITFSFSETTPYRGFGEFSRKDGPARFFRTGQEWLELFTSFALAYRVNKDFSAGLAFHWIKSDIRFLELDRDAYVDGNVACTGDCFEQPQNLQRLSVGGTADDFAFGAGILWRIRQRVFLGLSWLTRPLGGQPSIENPDEKQATVTSPATGQALGTGFARIRLNLPTVIHAGLRWHAGEKWDAEADFRYVNWAAQDLIEVRLSSAQFRNQLKLPERIVLYRGFQDTFALELRGVWRPSEKLRVALGARAESSAVPANAVNPNAIDNTSWKALSLLEWRPGGSLVLTGGYAFGYMFPTTETSSAFSSAKAIRCGAKMRDLDAQDCQDTFNGQGSPSAAGEYTRLSHTVSLALAFDFSWFW